MDRPFRHTTVVGIAVLLAAPALATADPPSIRPSPALVDDEFVEEVRAYLENEIVVMSVRNQNAEHDGVGQAEVKRLDEQWRQERDKAAKPLISATLANPLSSYLTRIQARSVGLFTEIFVTDELGLNVGQSNITSDYWQGDEAKFSRTFPRGVGAVFLDVPEWHAPSATWRVQLNLTVEDPESFSPIGVATFEINLTELARRTEANR